MNNKWNWWDLGNFVGSISRKTKSKRVLKMLINYFNYFCSFLSSQNILVCLPSLFHVLSGLSAKLTDRKTVTEADPVHPPPNLLSVREIPESPGGCGHERGTSRVWPIERGALGKSTPYTPSLWKPNFSRFHFLSPVSHLKLINK